MLSIICLILFTLMLIVTVNYYVSTVLHLCKSLAHKSGSVEFWHGGVLVGICFLLYHFI